MAKVAITKTQIRLSEWPLSLTFRLLPLDFPLYLHCITLRRLLLLVTLFTQWSHTDSLLCSRHWIIYSGHSPATKDPSSRRWVDNWKRPVWYCQRDEEEPKDEQDSRY